MKVVDASALAALLFGEPNAEEMSTLLARGPLAAPTLLKYEIGSVCLKKLRLYPAQRESLRNALALASRMSIDEVDVPIVEVLRLAEEKDLTVYDAAYLWLTDALQAELVTLDERLKRAAHPG